MIPSHAFARQQRLPHLHSLSCVTTSAGAHLVSPLDNYVAKLGAAKIAEKEAGSSVQAVIRAAQALAVPLGERWRTLVVPGMERLPRNLTPSTRNPLEAWPTMPEIIEKIRVYHQTVSDAEVAYEALSPEQEDAVQPPPSYRR